MRLSTTLLYISYATTLVYAYQSETSIFLYTLSQVGHWANLTYVNNGEHTKSASHWSKPGYCYPLGKSDSNPTLAEGAACNNLFTYHYFDSPTIKPGQTVTVSIEVPGYRLDCNVTGAQAQEGAGPDAGYIVQWVLDYGLTKESDPKRIVCTNTTTSQ